MRKWFGIGALALMGYAGGSAYQPTLVMGSSMWPTLRPNSVIWVDRLHYRTNAPQRGEVVVFNHEGKTYVKRIYRVAGEAVNYLSAQGEWVKLLRENRVKDAKLLYDDARNFAQFRRLVVPAGSVFVLGDNMTNSEDSRNFGPILVKDIIGRARLDVDPTIAMRIEFAPSPRALQQHTRNLEHARPTG